jgi:predicted nucleic acid-binding Zn ribbon protein
MGTGEELPPRPRRNWIQEERRRTLGDWVAFCLACGHTVRYFEDFEDLLPAACPHCAGELRHRCPACDARLPSAFQVECEECGAPVRDAELFGSPIRKPGR